MNKICIRCGTDRYKYYARGLCPNCYSKEWQKKNPEKVAEYRKKNKEQRIETLQSQGRLKWNFTEKPLTLRKLGYVVLRRRPYAEKGGFENRLERVKNYIRKKLCSFCRSKYISNYSNDFINWNVILCNKCRSNIIDSLNREEEKQNDPKLIKIKMLNKEKTDCLIWEIEFKTAKDIYSVLKEWYRPKDKIKAISSYGIKEKLQKEFDIVTSDRMIRRLLEKSGLLRTHVDALRTRILTGRMDYEDRHMNLDRRHIDYDKREARKRAGLEVKYKHIIIRAPKLLQDKVRELAKKYKKTISESLRLLLEATEGINVTYAERINYAIIHKQNVLCKRTANKRGVRVSLTGFDKHEIPLYIQRELAEEEVLRREIEEDKKKIYSRYIKEGRRWIVNVKDKMLERSLDINNLAKSISISKDRLKLILNNDIMAKQKDIEKIAIYFNMKEEEITSLDVSP